MPFVGAVMRRYKDERAYFSVIVTLAFFTLSTVAHAASEKQQLAAFNLKEGQILTSVVGIDYQRTSLVLTKYKLDEKGHFRESNDEPHDFRHYDQEVVIFAWQQLMIKKVHRDDDGVDDFYYVSVVQYIGPDLRTIAEFWTDAAVLREHRNSLLCVAGVGDCFARTRSYDSHFPRN